MNYKDDDGCKELFTSVNSFKLKELVGSVEELLINKTRLDKISSETGFEEISEIVNQEIGITNHIQDIIKNISSVPVGILFSAVKEGISESIMGIDKKINISTYGDDVQIDNSLIKDLQNIILYFINGFYHESMENAGEMLKNDNTSSGQMTISAASSINDIVIILKDDGIGIKIDNLHMDHGTTFISLSDIDSFEAVKQYFRTDFPKYNSPKGSIDLDNILQHMNLLGGTITLVMNNNVITSIQIIIPHSSSISQAMLVKVGDHDYALPISFIDKILKTESISIRKNNKYDAIIYQDRIVPLINVADKLEIDKSKCNGECIIIVKVDDNYTGLRVDGLQDQVDIVIKSKPPIIGHVKEFMGGAILGDGMVTLVFDVPSLVNS